MRILQIFVLLANLSKINHLLTFILIQLTLFIFTSNQIQLHPISSSNFQHFPPYFLVINSFLNIIFITLFQVYYQYHKSYFVAVLVFPQLFKFFLAVLIQAPFLFLFENFSMWNLLIVQYHLPFLLILESMEFFFARNQ